jgi:hypothetical protein
MGFPVSYYCPHCEAIVELERDGYLADKAVTPFPFEGWSYVSPDEPFEDREDVDGVEFTCGEDGTLKDGEEGCGQSFYLSFVKFDAGEEIDPRKPTEYVEIGDDSQPSSTQGPNGPSGPGGPGGFW